MVEQSFGTSRDARYGRDREGMFTGMMREKRRLEAEAGLQPYEVIPDRAMEEDETLIIVQRNAKDLRPAELENGALDPEWANKARENFLQELEGDELKAAFSSVIQAYQDKIINSDVEIGGLVPIAALEMFINTLRNYYHLFKRLTDELDRRSDLSDSEKSQAKTKAISSVKVLVVASDVELITPAGKTSDHKRGMETGQVKIDAIEKLFDIIGAGREQLLNSDSFTGDKGPFPYSVLKDLRMFEQTPKSMEFAEWLKAESEKRGINFWVAYEMDPDWVSEKRKELGIEGQIEIADRIKYAVTKFREVAGDIHKSEPGSRIVIDMTTAYDTISPFSRSILDMRVDDGLKVPYGAGVAITINKEGAASTNILGEEYPVEFTA